MMKLLITGAGGQLATDLRLMIERDGVARSVEGVFLTRNDLDITDAEKVLSVLKTESPDVIVNCASFTNVDNAEDATESAFAINAIGAGLLAQGAAEVGALLIQVSTDFVFDGSRSLPYKEDDKTGPLNTYASSKLEGEIAVRSNAKEHIIIRTSWLYSEHGRNFVKTVLRLANSEESLRVVSDQVGTPTWSMDLATVILEIADRYGKGKLSFGTYHYSSEGVTSWYDFALACIEEVTALGYALKVSDVEPINTVDYPTPALRPPYSVLDKGKIKRELGISIPHWRVSLRKMLYKLYGGANA